MARASAGGSSSGSAVAVAHGIVPFALGTDTAGSGRVPAGFNGLVGLKPTPGRVSTAGVLPACRTLDCVSVFAHTVTDAAHVLAVIEGADAADDYSAFAPRPRGAAGKAETGRAAAAGCRCAQRLRPSLDCGAGARTVAGPRAGAHRLHAAARSGRTALRRPVGGRASRRLPQDLRPPAAGDDGRHRAQRRRPRVDADRDHGLRRPVPAAGSEAAAGCAVAAGGCAGGAHRADASHLRRSRCRHRRRQHAAGYLHQLRQPARLVRAGGAGGADELRAAVRA